MEKYAKTIIKFSIILIVTVGLVTALSIPLGLYPKLGGFLLPGEGSIWSIPQEISKQETLKVAGLDDEVTVYRDQWGIPHIYGMSEKDIMFALGYVHAQDRLFQMDMARRATRGKLAEILGPSMLEADQFSLNKLKDYWAVQTYEHYLANNPEDENSKDRLAEMKRILSQEPKADTKPGDGLLHMKGQLIQILEEWLSRLQKLRYVEGA